MFVSAELVRGTDAPLTSNGLADCIQASPISGVKTSVIDSPL